MRVAGKVRRSEQRATTRGKVLRDRRARLSPSDCVLASCGAQRAGRLSVRRLGEVRAGEDGLGLGQRLELLRASSLRTDPHRAAVGAREKARQPDLSKGATSVRMGVASSTCAVAPRP